MSPNAALALVEDAPAAPTVAVVSELLGPVAAPDDAIFTFATGLLGFPECRRFALLPTERAGLFWLQSIEHTALTFLLADPFLHVANYSVELGAGDRADLDVTDASDVAVLCVVTLPHARHDRATANLQGPIALNVRNHLGRQLALAESRWGVRHTLDLTTRRI
jgi:flagellar assembly factor FliW